MNSDEFLLQAEASVIITGAHSSIGQQLIAHLIARNAQVIGLVTPWCDQTDLHKSNELIEYIACDLREPQAGTLSARCQNVSTLVHLAWARPKNTRDATSENIIIYDNVMAALPQATKTIFMSSVCATPDNPSHYGQAKYHLAQHMDPSSTIEIIAGLLQSDPAIGPYLALQNFICSLHARFKFIPSPPTLVSTQDQVMGALTDAVLSSDDCKGIVPGYVSKPVSLNDLIADILDQKNIFSVPLPVPTGLTLALLQVVRRLVPKMAISDRLITLLSVSPDSIENRLRSEQENPR